MLVPPSQLRVLFYENDDFSFKFMRSMGGSRKKGTRILSRSACRLQGIRSTFWDSQS